MFAKSARPPLNLVLCIWDRALKYTCTCCGYKTLEEPAGGTHEICELCDWEDDFVQTSDPDYEGGANGN